MLTGNTSTNISPEGIMQNNQHFISQEIEWFKNILNLRMESHANGKFILDIFQTCPPQSHARTPSPYEDTLRQLNLNHAERLLLILSFIPHIKPDVLDPFFITNQSLGRPFTEFGGASHNSNDCFIPTLSTVIFLLAGENIEQRLACYNFFNSQCKLFTQGVVALEQRNKNETLISSTVLLTAEFREKLISNKKYTPQFSTSFPAQKLETHLDWDDLVLNPSTLNSVEDIVTWHKFEKLILQDWGLYRNLKQGYRSLFYGPPGTGKTLTASLLSKSMNIPLYRVDLSRVVSKYIGETEKNLAGLFDYAESHQCILFFDEGDALFGSRGESNSANDRAANQQIAYLLQRIEEFSNIVILATNLKEYLDDAFSRRFQSEILFDMPDANARLKLWEDNFEKKPFKLSPEIDFKHLASEYVISGGSIINILRYACLQAVKRPNHEITPIDLMRGIRSELKKDRKVMLVK